LVPAAFELNRAAWLLLAIGLEFPAPADTNWPPAPGCWELLSAKAAIERAIANIRITKNRINKNRLKRKASEMFDIDRCFDADLAVPLP
jgi:hypothetical protein